MPRQPAKVIAKNKGVAALVKYLDEKGAMSRSELARAIDSDPSRLRRILLGAEPTLREARAFAEEAGVRMSAWLDAVPARGKAPARRRQAQRPVNADPSRHQDSVPSYQ